MASAAPVFPHVPDSSRLLARLRGFFRDFGATLRAAHEVERLLDCSDSELERRGLRRSDVVSHVFAKHLDRH